MELKMYRCRICGETHLGYVPAANCPFCGAHVELIAVVHQGKRVPQYAMPLLQSAEDITALNKVELTDTEREDLLMSIELERSNARFYLGMAERKDNDTLRSAYKRLAKIEAEHCSVFCKLAGVAKPADLLTPGETTGAWLSDIDESLVRENRATSLYAQFADRATSPRLKEVWSAISAVETDHITLDDLAKTYV